MLVNGSVRIRELAAGSDSLRAVGRDAADLRIIVRAVETNPGKGDRTNDSCMRGTPGGNQE